MNIGLVKECMAASLSGKTNFGEMVMKLKEANVERYIIDLIGLNQLTYGINGEYLLASLRFVNPSKPSKSFNSPGIKKAIQDSQQKKIDYPTFLRTIMAAGCCHYEVYIHGRKAIYFGCDGSHHIENFSTIS